MLVGLILANPDQVIMDCSSLEDGTFQLISQICFAVRVELDLCLSEFHEYGEIDVRSRKPSR